MYRQESETGRASRLRVSRWLAVVSGVFGTVIGIATNLYPDKFRGLLENTGLGISAEVASIIVTAIISSAATVLIYRLITSRQHPVIVAKTIEIGAAALADMPAVQDSVAGRSIKYLEAKRKSRDLVVLLNGLALDASDYRGYMAESQYHCVAITMFGFNTEEAADDDYRPISLQAHVGLLRFALSELFAKYPQKEISIVGFSFGADMIMFLALFAQEWLSRCRIKRLIMLDPNVNNSTLTISSQIARVDVDGPLAQMDSILESASTVSEFRNLCEYLYKITGKNFAQTRRHANDVVAMWSRPGYSDFLDRLGRVIGTTGDVYVVLSRAYEDHFNEIVRAAQDRGIDPRKMEASQGGHFDLISPRSLKDRLEGVIKSD